MTSSEDEWVQPVKGGQQKRKRTTEGEGNLKGFASAFATIMERPATVLESSEPKLASPAVEKKAAKEEKKIVGHDSTPVVSEDVLEEKFSEMAKRGVVKLFRAVAMHKRHVMEQEASRGIGLTKSGQIRRKRVPKPLTTEEKTKTMSGFLDALKKAKTPVATSV